MGLFSATFESTFCFNEKLFLGPNIPGKTIKKSLGLISMVTKGLNGNINAVYNNLLQDLIKKLDDIGGDSIVNTRFETGSYQQQGSGWVNSYLIIYGEAVVTHAES